MKFKFSFAATLAENKVKVEMFENGESEDQEFVRKHPFLLRLRMALAASRMKRRFRKIQKFNKRHFK